MLIPQSAIKVFAQSYSQHGVLTMNNVLPGDLANNLWKELNSINWVVQVGDCKSNQLHVPLSEVSNKDNVVDVLYSTNHELDMNDLFYIRLAAVFGDMPSDSMRQVSEFLNGVNFINTCKNITGIHDISRSWYSATCYDKGCFLGDHRDDHNPVNRVAFVLNLTRKWKIDWGGFLLIGGNSNGPPRIIPPIWNSITLFRIPVDHSVTCVSQAATERRYAISGWLRS